MPFSSIGVYTRPIDPATGAEFDFTADAAAGLPRAEVQAADHDAHWDDIKDALTLVHRRAAKWVTYPHDDTQNPVVFDDNPVDQAKAKGISVQGVLTADRNVILPTRAEFWWVKNETSTYGLTFKTAAGTGVKLWPGCCVLVFCDGTNIIKAGRVSGGETESQGASGSSFIFKNLEGCQHVEFALRTLSHGDATARELLIDFSWNNGASWNTNNGLHGGVFMLGAAPSLSKDHEFDSGAGYLSSNSFGSGEFAHGLVRLSSLANRPTLISHVWESASNVVHVGCYNLINGGGPTAVRIRWGLSVPFTAGSIVCQKTWL